MAIIDREADEYIQTLRETPLSWLGALAAEALAEMDDLARATPEQRFYAAYSQLEEIRRLILEVVKREREFTLELMSLAPRANVRQVVIARPAEQNVILTSPERTAVIDRFVNVLSSSLDESIRTVRRREGLPE